MLNVLIPDRVFAKFDDITPSFLTENGIKALIIDIDNTLAPYETAEPDDRVRAWFEELAACGISATLMSNNDRERVELFNASLGLNAYYDSKKPLAKNLKSAMADMQSDATDTAVIGDQLFTDAYGGKRLGLMAITVPPIKDKDSFLFKLKRSLEVPLIRKYVRTHGEEAARICEFWLLKKYKTGDK